MTLTLTLTKTLPGSTWVPMPSLVLIGPAVRLAIGNWQTDRHNAFYYVDLDIVFFLPLCAVLSRSIKAALARIYLAVLVAAYRSAVVMSLWKYAEWRRSVNQSASFCIFDSAFYFLHSTFHNSTFYYALVQHHHFELAFLTGLVTRAMLCIERVFARATCPSVCLSVCLLQPVLYESREISGVLCVSNMDFFTI